MDSPPEAVLICRKSVIKSGRCKVLLFASMVPMQVVQGWEHETCYWGIYNKALSSSNTHTRIDCYLCFAFGFLWLLLRSSRECTAKWIGLSSNWYAANVLKYLCSNRFCTLGCLVSTEVGEGSFPVVCAEEPEANVPLLIILAVVLQPEVRSKLQRYNPFHFYKSLQQERRPGKNSHGRWIGEKRRLKYKSLKLMILEFTLLRFKILHL